MDELQLESAQEKFRDAFTSGWALFFDRGIVLSDAVLEERCSSLMARYQEPHRAYHTLTHIQHCLSEWEWAAPDAHDPIGLKLALLYHDTVYDIRYGDNEWQSARVFADEGVRLSPSLPEVPWGQIGVVCDLIRSTQQSYVVVGPDVDLMHDIDYAILGAPGTVFAQYDLDIAYEYHTVEREKFLVGRGQFLSGELVRPSIFRTALFQGKYEQQARHNLQEYMGLYREMLLELREGGLDG